MRLRLIVVMTVLASVATVTPTGRAAEACPSQVDDAFASREALRQANQVMADLGPRPTASPAHEAYIDSVEQELGSVPGVRVSALHETIKRQLELDTWLHVDGVDVPVAGAVPYTKPVPDGVTAPLLYISTGTPIADTDVTGKIVVRDAASGTIPMAVFSAVAWFVYDPAGSFDYAGNYERDWVGAGQRVIDLQEAEDGNAAGILFVHGLPRDQVQGQYAPYTGDHWAVPGLYLGVDEGAPLIERLAEGESLDATLGLTASQGPAPTRTLIGSLPGKSKERIVIESHTDGMNAVWDNGPVALLALAEWFAALPIECRPRTLEFVFTTAHLYLEEAGAHRYAEVLDKDYDKGTVALVVALEHLGANEFQAVPREPDTLPGRELESTGESELFATFSIESPVLVNTIRDRIVAHDLRRTWLLRGADAPQVGFPPHRSFGGEGGPYREKIVPTVAAITGPWTLFDPAFTLGELIDFDLMRRQTMAFGDVVLAVDDVPREVIAGADTVYRAGRELTGE